MSKNPKFYLTFKLNINPIFQNLTPYKKSINILLSYFVTKGLNNNITFNQFNIKLLLFIPK